jgi:predicted nucleic acid-binding protein
VTNLLDGNVLIALALDSHEFHDRARRWFDGQTEPFAA